MSNRVAQHLPSSDPWPESLKALLAQILDRRQRLIIVLIFYEGLTKEEVRQTLNIDQQTLEADFAVAVNKVKKAASELS